MLGLDVLIDDLRMLASGHCAACRQRLPRRATRTHTCDEICHRIWVERLVMTVGETTRITDAVTGVVYAVPTRTILEQGIAYADLATYPTTR